MATKKSLIEFLFNYSEQNMAVMYIFIKDPYYTRWKFLPAIYFGVLHHSKFIPTWL